MSCPLGPTALPHCHSFQIPISCSDIQSVSTLSSQTSLISVSHSSPFLSSVLIYFWLCWLFIAVLLSGSGERCLLPLWSRGSRECGLRSFQHVSSMVAVLGSRAQAQQLWSTGLVQGLNSRLLHWQVDSSLLSHQGSPPQCF